MWRKASAGGDLRPWLGIAPRLTLDSPAQGVRVNSRRGLRSRKIAGGARKPRPPDAKKFWTTPKKIVAVVMSLLAAWAVPYFAPGIWNSLKRNVGGVGDISVTVLTADQFDSRLLSNRELVVPRSLAEVADARQRMNREEYIRWGRSSGGVDGGSTAVRLVLRGTTPERVTIQKISATVTRKEQPVEGLFVISEKGGAVTPHHMSVHLESGSSTWYDAQGKPTDPATFWVSNQEEEVVDVVGYAGPSSPAESGFDCYWTIEITYSDGRSSPRTINVGPPGGGTFRTSAVGRASVWNASTGQCSDKVPGRAWCGP